METKIDLTAVYKPSADVVFREIEGEPIIVPLTSGVGDIENALFTLNETGKSIWDRLDGKKKLQDVIDELEKEFDDPSGGIATDVIGFTKETLKRGILVEASSSGE